MKLKMHVQNYHTFYILNLLALNFLSIQMIKPQSENTLRKCLPACNNWYQPYSIYNLFLVEVRIYAQGAYNTPKVMNFPTHELWEILGRRKRKVALWVKKCGHDDGKTICGVKCVAEFQSFLKPSLKVDPFFLDEKEIFSPWMFRHEMKVCSQFSLPKKVWSYHFSTQRFLNFCGRGGHFYEL